MGFRCVTLTTNIQVWTLLIKNVILKREKEENLVELSDRKKQWGMIYGCILLALSHENSENWLKQKFTLLLVKDSFFSEELERVLQLGLDCSVFEKDSLKYLGHENGCFWTIKVTDWRCDIMTKI